MTESICIILPTFWTIKDDVYKIYGGLEPRTVALAKYFAQDDYEVKVLAPRGSYLSGKNIKTYSGSFFAWNGRDPPPYALEKELINSNLEIIKECDAILEDNHFGYLRYIKSVHPDDFGKVANSWDHHCFTGNVKIKTISKNGRVQIQRISNLKNEKEKLLSIKDKEVTGHWFKENLKSSLYKITLMNGFEIDSVTDDHIHSTNNGLKRTSELNDSDFLPISLYPWTVDKDLGSYDLGWLIGFIGAEGSINKDSITLSQKNDTKGKDNIEKVLSISKSYGHYSSVSKNNRDELALSISRTILPLVLSFIGGKYATKKYLKNKVWNSSEEFRNGLWDGWIDGDGNSGSVATYSKLLAEDLSILLRSLGVLSSVAARDKHGFSSNKCYIIRPYKRTKGNGFHVSYIKSDSNDTMIAWVKIKSIDDSRNKRNVVYDYNIDSDDHLFELANGIITHNCDNLNSLPKYPQNIIAVSKWLMSALREKFKNQGHKFWHAYSGLIRDNYPDTFDYNDKESNLWLFLARFSSVKGPDVVIELAKQYKDDNFVLIGDVLFSNESHYARTLKEVGDSLDNVKIIFNVSYDEKIDYLRRCTGLLHPGRWEEPLGWDMLEGLYFGSKVLAFDRGAVREIYQHDKHGLIVPFSNNEGNNIEMFSRAFRAFKKTKVDPNICRQRILDIFDFQKFSYPVYKEVLFGVKNNNKKI